MAADGKLMNGEAVVADFSIASPTVRRFGWGIYGSDVLPYRHGANTLFENEKR